MVINMPIKSFLLTMDDLKKVLSTYNSVNISVSHVNNQQKHKNKYSRALIQAKYLHKYFRNTL